MKKLMVAAAVAAMTAGAFASEPCGPGQELKTCAYVFDLSGSGKISAENAAYTYKMNKSISPKGYVVIDVDYTAELLAFFKAPQGNVILDAEGEVNECGFFGKKYPIFDEQTYKAGKTYTLDSDLGFTFDGATDYSVSAYFSTFGTAKLAVSKGSIKSTDCGPAVTNAACSITVTPVKYSGWFAGFFEDCMDQIDGAYNCNGCTVELPADNCLFGGKCALKFNKKLVTKEAAQAAFLTKYAQKADIFAADFIEPEAE